jgi:hypothetical protein
MASNKFSVAFSTIGTNSFFRFLKLVFKYPVDFRYWWRCFVSGILSLIAEPFRWYENFKYTGKLRQVELPESPVFILGHWRSGTTLLHNLMCQDKQFSFVTTYQGVFVNVFFCGRWFFRPIMKALMPERRATDNVKLAAGFPQEEGFALANMGSFAFYTYWYFPKLWRVFYRKYVRCEDVSKEQLLFYRNQYRKLIAQSVRFHGRKGFVSKNPPNTGRINQLLEMFPNARFIYIYRNPMMVFQSTVQFFAGTLEALQLQKISKEELEELVFGFYENLIKDYEEQKALIPEGHLVEIRYEEFISDPLAKIEMVYTQLGLPDFMASLPAFRSYLRGQQKFHQTRRQFTEEEKIRIRQRLAFAFNLYGY